MLIYAREGSRDPLRADAPGPTLVITREDGGWAIKSYVDGAFVSMTVARTLDQAFVFASGIIAEIDAGNQVKSRSGG